MKLLVIIIEFRTGERPCIFVMVDLPEQERTLDEDDFYSFMSETYDRCIKLGLQPERLSHDLKPLTDLSESVPWDEIPIHIEQQIAREQQLEQEIPRLQSVA